MGPVASMARAEFLRLAVCGWGGLTSARHPNGPGYIEMARFIADRVQTLGL